MVRWVALWLLLAASAHAEVLEATLEAPKHRLGLIAGGISGIGLAYRQELTEDWGLHVAAVGWTYKSGSFLSASFNMHRTLVVTGRTKLYAPMGLGMVYERRSLIMLEEATTSTGTLMAGGGVGLELQGPNQFGVVIEIAATLAINLFGGVSVVAALPVPAVGLFYYW